MTPETVNSILTVAAVGIPELAALIKAFWAFKKTYPGISDADLAALLAAITGTNDTAADALISKIDADQAAHPPTP
jgi:hypothetical protein